MNRREMLASSTLTLAAAYFYESAHADAILTPRQAVNADLLKVRAQFARRATLAQVEANNEAVIANLPTSIAGGTRAKSITQDYANNLIQSINSHPVAGFADRQYQQAHVKIGYCFGRAAYAHLALLNRGLDRRAIRKIWAVGPMQTGDTAWAFHVSTIALGDDGQWWTIDNFTGRSMPVTEWMKYMKTLSTDGKLTFFISEPQKFSVSLGKYDRIQLGLDLDRSTDWYKHYFRDLTRWFGNHNANREYFRDYGLPHLTRPEQVATLPEPNPMPAPVLEPMPILEPVPTIPEN